MCSPFVQFKHRTTESAASLPTQIPTLSPLPPEGLLSPADPIVQVKPAPSPPTMNLQQVAVVGYQNAPAVGAYQQVIYLPPSMPNQLIPYPMSNQMVPCHSYYPPPNMNAPTKFCCPKYRMHVQNQMQCKMKTGQKRAGRIPHSNFCAQRNPSR